MNNPALEQAQKRVQKLMDKEGATLRENHCYGTFGTTSGQLRVAQISAYYIYDNNAYIDVSANVITEISPTSTEDPIIGRGYVKDTVEFKTEQYVTPAGLAAIIVNGADGYHAYFSMNGAAFCISFTGVNALESLQEILDAFEF